MSLADMVRDVAARRRAEDCAKADLDESRREWEEDNAPTIELLEHYKARRAEAEEELRLAVLAAPEEEVKTTFGVGIRNATEFSYDERIAIEWAIRENAAGVLKLSYANFERAMRGEVAKGTIPGFVHVMAIKQATIARDLSEVLRRTEHGSD